MLLFNLTQDTVTFQLVIYKFTCFFLISTLILSINYPFCWICFNLQSISKTFSIFKVILTKEEFIFLIEKKKRDEGRIQNALSHFSRRGNRIDRGNRVSSRLLDPPSHNNLTQAWRVKPWPGIQGVLRGSSIPEFQAFKVDLSNLTDFYERSFKSESTIDPVARVPEKGRDRWNKGIIKTNSWYSW